MAELANLITAAVLLTNTSGAEETAQAFGDLGFRTLVVAEGTMLITGSERMFEENFGAEIIYAPSGIMAFRAGPDPNLSRELPLDRLEKSLSDSVRAAGFQARIDYGPVNFKSTLSVEESAMTILSAAVILRNAEDTDDAQRGFAGLGFEVQTISPGVLLLTGDISVFKDSFKAEISFGEKGAFVVDSTGDVRQLPAAGLPAELGSKVAEAEFESPPEFGPANF